VKRHCDAERSDSPRLPAGKETIPEKENASSRRAGGLRTNRKNGVFFGPPLARLTSAETNTMGISGKINRTAERYLEIVRRHGLDLSKAEQACIAHVCGFGFMSPQEIRELPLEVRQTAFQCDRLDKEDLAARLEAASYADLVVVIEKLGF